MKAEIHHLWFLYREASGQFSAISVSNEQLYHNRLHSSTDTDGQLMKIVMEYCPLSLEDAILCVVIWVVDNLEECIIRLSIASASSVVGFVVNMLVFKSCISCNELSNLGRLKVMYWFRVLVSSFLLT